MINLDVNYIGKFISEDDLLLSEEEQTIFFVKMLTVAQRPLIFDIDGRVKKSNTLDILYSNIVGWHNFLDENNNQIDFDINKLSLVRPAYLDEISNFIINNSTINGRFAKEVKASVRMSVYIEEYPSEIWECIDCLRNHFNARRNCLKFGLDKVELDLSDEEDGEEKSEITEINRVDREKISKYSLVKNKKKKEETKADVKEIVLYIGKEKYEACPLSMVSDEIKHAVSLIFWSTNNNVLLNAGGILDQSNLFYEMRQTVLNEESKAREEIRKIKDKNKDKSGSSVKKFRR